MLFTLNSVNETSGSTKLLVSPLPRLDEFPLRGVAVAEFRDAGLKGEKKLTIPETVPVISSGVVTSHLEMCF